MFSGSFLLSDSPPQQAFPAPQTKPLYFPKPTPQTNPSRQERFQQARKEQAFALEATIEILKQRTGAQENDLPLESFCTTYFRKEQSEPFSPYEALNALRETGELDLDFVGERLSRTMAEESLPEMLLEAEASDERTDLNRNVRGAKELCLFLLYQQKIQIPDALDTAPALTAALSGVIAGVYALESLSLYLARCPSPETDAPLRLAFSELAKDTFLAVLTSLRELPSVEDVVEWRDNPFCRLRVLMDGLIYRI